MLFLAAAVVAARFDEAGEEAVQAEESIRDQRVEDERKDGISYKCGDATIIIMAVKLLFTLVGNATFNRQVFAD